MPAQNPEIIITMAPLSYESKFRAVAKAGFDVIYCAVATVAGMYAVLSEEGPLDFSTGPNWWRILYAIVFCWIMSWSARRLASSAGRRLDEEVADRERLFAQVQTAANNIQGVRVQA